MTARRPRLPSPASAHPPVIAFVKGAPDVILDLCGQRLESGRAVGLTEEQREAILEQNRDMASNALRVLAWRIARCRKSRRA